MVEIVILNIIVFCLLRCLIVGWISFFWMMVVVRLIKLSVRLFVNLFYL